MVICDRGDSRLVMLGHEDGAIQVFSLGADLSLGLLATIKSQTKLIQSLALHPLYLTSGAEAELPNYLASANNEFPVHVFDLTSVLEAPAEAAQPQIIVTPTVTLTGHLQRVIELAWSPHESQFLCSVSYDFSCQVGNISKDKCWVYVFICFMFLMDSTIIYASLTVLST